MQEVIELIANYGIGLVCVAYLIYFQSTTMKEMTKTMQEMTKSLENVNLRLSSIENKIK